VMSPSRAPSVYRFNNWPHRPHQCLWAGDIPSSVYDPIQRDEFIIRLYAEFM
jgi:hypothetical protein